MSKISKLLDSATSPALQAVGFMAGMAGQRGINKIFETDAFQGFLGNETATDFKRFVTPITMVLIGVGVSNYVSDDSAIKDIANGAAVSGAVNIGMELLFNKNLMAGLDGGILGDIMGDDDLDLIAGDDYDDDDDDDDTAPAPRAIPAAGVGYQLPTGRAALPQQSNIMGIGAPDRFI